MESFKICDSVVGILGDGCAKNTGAHRGVIRQLEEKLCRTLAHFICLYHCNELPFRYIFDHLDGSTSGPKTFNGDIGRQIGEDLTELQVMEFKRIRGKVEKPPCSVISKLSKDQKYLLDIALACQTGQSAFLTKKDWPLQRDHQVASIIHAGSLGPTVFSDFMYQHQSLHLHCPGLSTSSLTAMPLIGLI